jgi:copper chaperone CopZ
MNCARDRAILAALEHITDILVKMEGAMHLQINYDKSTMDATMDGLRKNVEEIREAIEEDF